MKKFNLLFVLFAICFIVSSCSNDDGDEPNGSSDNIEEALPGYWYGGGGWEYGNMWLFKDKFSVGRYRARGYWTYEDKTNIVAINASGSSATITIHSFSKYGMVCSAPECASPSIGYTKGTNAQFAEVFMLLSERCFDLELPRFESIEFDDNFHGFTSDGKEIVIKNPFYLKKSSIIYDGKEYEYNGKFID